MLSQEEIDKKMDRNHLSEVLKYSGYSILPSGTQCVLQRAYSGKWFLVNALQWYKISPAGAADFGIFAC